MSISRELLVRIAQKIQEQLQLAKIYRISQLQTQMSILLEHLDQYQALRRKLGICASRSWTAAANKLTSCVANLLRDIPSMASSVEWSIGPCQAQVPCLGELLADLEQAQQEFPTLKYDPEEQILSVTTEPIELEGIYLGDFEIRLQIPGLAEMKYTNLYYIVALDPHPAATNECVTHPHVSDDRLCAGDASAAIGAALTAGRICDFFQLVGSVLATYNSGSPFVSLNDWHGTPCYGCGYTMSEDDRYFCERCENDYCEECFSYCRQCDDSLCRGCLEECRVCGELVCSSCMTACPECGEELCGDCLKNDDCPCLAEMEVEDESDERTSQEAASTIDAA